MPNTVKTGYIIYYNQNDDVTVAPVGEREPNEKELVYLLKLFELTVDSILLGVQEEGGSDE